MIIREQYLKLIRPFYEQNLIKVITGIRRSGKSVLLQQIIDELKTNDVTDDQIIYINFEFDDWMFIKNRSDLHSYVEEKMNKKKKAYLFFDEIQNVTEWEKTVNSFKAKYKDMVSIFVTGSNSDLLDGDLATHIAGRYVGFKVYPFTFKEVCELKGLLNKSKYELAEDFDDYMMWGGLPQRFSQRDEIGIRTYLSDVYDSIVVKDIINRFKIKELDLLNRILEYIVTTPSQTFSAENLSKEFKNKDDRVVGKDTLYNYLDYMSKALLIKKADRYDVRGKRILTGKYKYYLTDLGLGQIKNTSKKEQRGAYIENIVFNELVARGYDVKIGSIKNTLKDKEKPEETQKNGEIDFIATKHGEKIYIQACYLLYDDKVIKREFGAYDNIKDHFPKYVISYDTFNQSQDGIIHKNIIDWLLEVDK